MGNTYALRSAVADSANALASTALVTPEFTRAVARRLTSKLSDRLSIKDFGAIGDGASHPLSGYFATLAAAQSVYPHVVALADEIDWAAAQAAIEAAKLVGGNLYKGAAVVVPAGDFVTNRPLVLPRPGNAKTPIPHLLGENPRTSLIIGSAAFLAGRGLIEWDAVTDYAEGGKIAHLGLRTPVGVPLVRCIYYKANKTGGMAAVGTTIADVMAERLSCDFIDLYLEGNNQDNEALIDLEVNLRISTIRDVKGDPWRGIQPAGTLPQYDTLLLRVAHQYGGLDPGHNEDSVGLYGCRIENLQSMVLAGGWVRMFQGRAMFCDWSSSFNNGPLPGRANAVGYAFYNSDGTTLTNLMNEGGGGLSQFRFVNCREVKGFNLGANVGGAAANATAWAASHAYTGVGTTQVIPTVLASGAAVAPRNRVYTLKTAGTSGGTEPAWPDSGDVTDGTAVWTASTGYGASNGVMLESCEGCEFEGHYIHPGSTPPSARLTKGVSIDAASRNNHFRKWTLRGNVTSATNVNNDILPEVSVAGTANSIQGELVQEFGNYRLPFTVGVDPEKLDAVFTYHGDDNLLGTPAALDSGSWTRGSLAGVTADVSADPISGTGRGDKIVEAAATAQHYLQQAYARGAVSKQQTFSVYLKAGERTTADVMIGDNVGAARLTCNLLTGAYTTTVAPEAGFSFDGSSAANAGNGWWRFAVTATFPAATSFTVCWIFPNTVNVYAGDGTSGIYAFGAQLENAAAATPWREANPTLFVGIDAPVIRMDSPMLTARTVSFSNAGAYNGAWFKIVQTNGGAFARTFAGVKSIPASTNATVEFTFDGSAWNLTDYAADTDAAIAARSLTTHTHTYNDGTLLGFGTAASKTAGNAVGNVPMVESGGTINASIIPAVPATHVYVDANQAAMLAHGSAVIGDISKRTDLGSSFILSALPSSTLGNWIAITDAASVTSVNGLSGSVVLTTSNVAEGTGLYYTTGRVNTDAPNVTLGSAAAAVFSLTGQALDYKTAAAHAVLAGPTAGGAATPTIRVLVAGDLPTHTHAEGDVTNLVADLAGKAALVHIHDDRYYTETETDAFLAGKANAPGANSFTGQQTYTVSAIGSRATFQALLGGGYVGSVIAVKDQAGAVTATIGADGGISAVSFVGDGSALTGLAAGNLASGTVPLARLSASSAGAAGTMSAADFAKLARLETVVSAGTITTNYTPDAAAAAIFDITLGAATVTINAPTNPVNGRKVEYRLRQDVTGNRAVAWNAIFRFGTDITGTTLSTAASKTDRVLTEYNSIDSKWDITAFIKGS